MRAPASAPRIEPSPPITTTAKASTTSSTRSCRANATTCSGTSAAIEAGAQTLAVLCSLLLAGSLAGLHLRVATPPGYEPATGKPAKASAARANYTKVFGKGLMELAIEDNRVVTITAAMPIVLAEAPSPAHGLADEKPRPLPSINRISARAAKPAR